MWSYHTNFCSCYFVFFFKQKTAYEMRISDWSSDVCSSDLHIAYRLRSARHIVGRERGVDKEHEACLAQFARDRQRCLGTPAGAVKCLFQIDFGAGALETGDTPLADFGDDLIPRPAGSQIFRPDIDIIFVEGVDRPFRPTRVLAKRAAQADDAITSCKGRQRILKDRRIGRPRTRTFRHAAKLVAAEERKSGVE